jgi:hypothetical protein
MSLLASISLICEAKSNCKSINYIINATRLLMEELAAMESCHSLPNTLKKERSKSKSLGDH